MHADNIDFADQMEAWKNDPKNKGKSKPGDDRTPPWRWIGCLNSDDPKGGFVTIPSEYLMRSIMGGAAEVPTGKKQKTFKSQSQSGLLCAEFHWTLLQDGKPIRMSDINECQKLEKFSEHKEAAQMLGFDLFVKRAKIGQTKHIRVRPIFDKWSITGHIVIMDDAISVDTLATILDIAGKFKGMGDWRPGAPTPGAYGMFTSSVKAI